MKVLDGRKANKVPEIIEISDINILGEWFDYNAYKRIYCVEIDGRFVPCVLDKGKGFEAILCAEYKTRKGFERWLARFYEYAMEV